MTANEASDSSVPIHMKVALLISPTEQLVADNYYLLGRQFLASSHEVDLCTMDSISMARSTVTALAQRFEEPHDPGTPFQSLVTKRADLTAYDLVWILALGLRSSFLDKIQILHNLEGRVPIINSLDTILFLKSKYLPSAYPGVFPHPDSYASADWNFLYGIIAEDAGEWIIKPPAGSFGRDVYRVSSKDSNTKAILQSMTGNDGSQFCLIQKYINEIQDGEKRVLFANGEVVGQYLRHNPTDHRTNLAQGGLAELCDLTRPESILCARVGEFLRRAGAYYAAIDMAYPYVIEVNVVNPGGLKTLQSLQKINLSDVVLNHILNGVLSGE
jgi:glutathione synthase